MRKIKIAGHVLGTGRTPMIIAEAGINHNGELKKAFEMIEAAKSAGADAVKFQTFKAEEFVSDSDVPFTYRSQGKTVTEPMLEMFKRYEFSREQWFSIKKKCDETGILFLSTPQNRPDLDLLLELGIPAVKVGSDDFTNTPLVKDYATTGLPLILSIGMANLEEVRETLEAAGALKKYPVILLVCTSEYPTPPEDANLLRFKTLSQQFPDIPLGFYDHTRGATASSLAVAFGACVLEKHFTLDHDLPGPDHWFSEDPAGLKLWVDSIRASFAMMGSEAVRPTPLEEKMKVLARRSVVALRDIEQGELLDSRNVGLRRPGNGLPPHWLPRVLGSKAAASLRRGALLKQEDISQ